VAGHTFLFREGTWRAAGEYRDGAGNVTKVDGEAPDACRVTAAIALPSGFQSAAVISSVALPATVRFSPVASFQRKSWSSQIALTVPGGIAPTSAANCG